MARERNLKGLNMDTRPQEQPEGTYPFAKNGIQYDTKGAVRNEPGFVATGITANGEIMGIIETDGPAVIYSVDPVTKVSYVGTYDRTTNTYIVVKNDSAFPAGDKWNFSRDYPIHGEFQRNYKNERVVAWSDNNMPPRMLNLDNTASVATAKDTLLFLQAQTPTITTEVTTGGILDKGAYFVAVKLLKNDGSETGYLSISAPAIVSSAGSGSITDRALSITLSNLDQSFDKVQVAIVTRINGAYTAVALDPHEITPRNLVILYTGDNLSTTLTLDEILVPNAVYSKVGVIGQLNDALYLADLQKYPELNMQMYANAVRVRVKSELIDVIPQNPDHVSGKKKSLMHQEVYGLYIRYHKKVGQWSQAFHIPGNAPLAGDIAAATGVHETALAAKVFQVQDTNRNLNKAAGTVDTGIWTNTTETYPDLPMFDSTSIGGPNLRNVAVRHHRMPSLQFCKDNFYAGESEYGKTKMDILSLEVSNVMIPPSLVGIIDGYEILIAKRTLSNSLVLGQSLLMVAAQSNDLHTTERGFVSTGGNWHSNTTDTRKQGVHTLPSDPKTLIVSGRDWLAATGGGFGSVNVGSSTAVGKPKLRFRFHSFDMLFSKPALTPAYMSPQLKMRVDNLSTEYPNGGLIEDGMQNGGRVPVILIADYTKGRVPTTLASNLRVRQVENTRYLTNGANTGEWNNADLESCYVGNIKWQGLDTDATNNDLPLDVDLATVNLKTFSSHTQRPQHEETYLVNLMDIKADLYSSFYNQALVASGQLNPITSPVNIVYAGDTFLNDYSFHTYGWFDGDNNPGDSNTNEDKLAGYKVVRRFICEAVSNVNLRYEVESNIYSKWWPNSPLTAQPQDTLAYLFSFSRSQDPNQFGYSKDLNTANDFGNYQPFDPYAEDLTSMPFRIHRGGKMPRSGKIRSWRTFLPLDYYEMQKNMGRVKRLVGKHDRLLIHCENALFLTQDKAKLDAGVLSVTLGAGDIFQFEPQEAMNSKQGYAGTQHPLGAVDTPWGYVFVDSKQGQVFMYRDGVKLMNEGLNQFFRQYLKGVDHNPYIGNGITIGYDPEYKRILLTVKNKTLTANIANFVPNYSETPDFYAKLTANQSIVYKNGRYQKFLGVNGTAFSCPVNHAPTGTAWGVTIPENTIQGTVITNATAHFADVDAGDVLSYSIVGGNPSGAFAINATTGDIIVNNAVMLSYDAASTMSPVIRATDTAGNSVDVTLTVTLTRVTKAAGLNNYLFMIDEGLANGSNVGQVVGVDPRGQTLTYALVTAGTPFSINTSTGMLTVADTTQLVYRTARMFTFQVSATNTDAQVSTSTVTVLLNKINHSPVGTSSSVNLYKGQSQVGQLVTTLVTSDPDSDPTTVTWLNQADLGAKFSFVEADNEIHLVDPALVNVGDVYTLNFQVTDSLGATGTFTITINVYALNLSFAPYNYNCITAACSGAGDALAPDNSYCFHYSDTPATPPGSGTPISTVGNTNYSYGIYGTLIYDAGFAVNGTGTHVKISTANTWWINPAGVGGATTLDHSPLNRTALWAAQAPGYTDMLPLNSYIGFTVPINIPTTKTYYIGMGGDNQCQIKVNGVAVVTQDSTAMGTALATSDGVTNNVDVAFKFWHIYPVVLSAGQNYIEVTGENFSGPAGFGFEIYDNTSAQIQAAASYADLNLVFSTKDYQGQQLQLGGTVAWSCPSGYALVATPGLPLPYTCRQIIKTTPTVLHTKHWNQVRVSDSTGAVLSTLNNVSGQTYMGQAVPTYADEAASPDC